MILADENIMPPREWMHNYVIKNKDDETLKSIMIKNYLPGPYHWENE